jgi:asparagine synthase (glutamine-hydrolysing)
LLAPDRLAGEGWLDPALVARRWEEHQDGRRDRTYQLWDVLMFEAWLEAHHG